MRIIENWQYRYIENWQYRYIEKCLYAYKDISESKLHTEIRMKQAIDNALEFFRGTCHETMMKEFYFQVDHHRKRLSNTGHYRWVCEELLHTEEPNGYVMRREIVYRIAMNCYALNLFQLKQNNS